MLITMTRDHVKDGVRLPQYNNYDLPPDEAMELINRGVAEPIGPKPETATVKPAETREEKPTPKAKRSKKSGED